MTEKLKLNKQLRMLDLGCGLGYSTLALGLLVISYIRLKFS